MKKTMFNKIRTSRQHIAIDRETLKELERRYNNPTSLISRRYSFEEFIQMMVKINY